MFFVESTTEPVVYSDDDLEKSGRRAGAKYLFRTGVPGNYKYFYKYADGRIRAADGDDHKLAMIEHIKRLLTARNNGHHELTNAEIKAKVGVERSVFHNTRSNHARTERAGGDHGFLEGDLKESIHRETDSDEYARHIRDHHDDETVVSHSDNSAPVAEIDVARELRRVTRDLRAEDAEAAERDLPPETPEMTTLKWRRPEEATTTTPPEARRRTAIQEFEDYAMVRGHRDPNVWVTSEGNYKIHKVGSDFTVQKLYSSDDPTVSAGWHVLEHNVNTPNEAIAVIQNDKAEARRRVRAIYDEIMRDGGMEPKSSDSWISAAESERAAAAARVEKKRAARVAAASAAESDAQKVQELLEKLKNDYGIDLHERKETAASEVRAAEAETRAEERAPSTDIAQAVLNAESAPESEAHTAAVEADPDFAAADTHVAEMAEVAAAGGNPYIEKARAVFEKVKADLTPERRDATVKLFAAMDAAGDGAAVGFLKAKFKDMYGHNLRKSDIDHFEKATFFEFAEVAENPPFDHEMERIKRGYARMQFERAKPFLKDAWKEQHPDAPPPMPAFGDLKTWSQHGGAKPAWAGTTRTAVPESIYQAAHKSPDGEPKYPPEWMPLHLMPVWNYVAKSEEKSGGAAIWTPDARGKVATYASAKVPEYDQSSPTGYRLDFGNQARRGEALQRLRPEGKLLNAMRRYVQMRGGVDQLVDIPHVKQKNLPEGVSIRDLFKSGEVPDHILFDIIKNKIIDPVALIGFIKETSMSKSLSKSLPKSVRLVVDASFQRTETIKKSEEFVFDLRKSKIEKIRYVLEKRGAL